MSVERVVGYALMYVSVERRQRQAFLLATVVAVTLGQQTVRFVNTNGGRKRVCVTVFLFSIFLSLCACVRVCVRACVRACVHACVCECVCAR